MIPSNAKKVFTGIIFEVFQWEQTMYDGSVQTFERLSRPDTAEVITLVEEKIVIQKQQQPDRPEPFLCLPGGHIEHGEDPLAGAKRELLEETGLESADWELVGAFNRVSKMEWKNFVYIARGCQRVAEQKLDAGEKIELEEISFDALLRLADEGDALRMEPGLRTDLVRARYDATFRALLHRRLFGV